MVGKAEMGQHIASTMAQIVAEELEASGSNMNIVLASNDPKYNDPVLGALITGGSWSTGMNFDAMCRAGAAGRITLIEAGAEMMGVPEGELLPELRRSSMRNRQERQPTPRSSPTARRTRPGRPTS